MRERVREGSPTDEIVGDIGSEDSLEGGGGEGLELGRAIYSSQE